MSKDRVIVNENGIVRYWSERDGCLRAVPGWQITPADFSAFTLEQREMVRSICIQHGKAPPNPARVTDFKELSQDYQGTDADDWIRRSIIRRLKQIGRSADWIARHPDSIGSFSTVHRFLSGRRRSNDEIVGRLVHILGGTLVYNEQPIIARPGDDLDQRDEKADDPLAGADVHEGSGGS